MKIVAQWVDKPGGLVRFSKEPAFPDRPHETTNLKDWPVPLGALVEFHVKAGRSMDFHAENLLSLGVKNPLDKDNDPC